MKLFLTCYCLSDIYCGRSKTANQLLTRIHKIFKICPNCKICLFLLLQILVTFYIFQKFLYRIILFSGHLPAFYMEISATESLKKNNLTGSS